MDTHKIELTYEDALIDQVAKRCTEGERARNIDNILTTRFCLKSPRNYWNT